MSGGPGSDAATRWQRVWMWLLVLRLENANCIAACPHDGSTPPCSRCAVARAVSAGFSAPCLTPSPTPTGAQDERRSTGHGDPS